MGIDFHSAKFLKSEAKRGVAFERTLTLGHQTVCMDKIFYRSFIEPSALEINTIFADDFFRVLGAKTLDMMDASNYEGANMLHDLNEPVKPELQEKYDCVFDGGALEHVFNFPQALKNCMEMVKIGGHFIAITPANAFCGHGFYQFSPELFYNVLSGENGYSVERLLFIRRNQWYSIRKPSEVGERVELLTDNPTLLFVSARRHEKKQIFKKWPQQSDYSAVWEEKKKISPASGTGSAKEKFLSSSSFLRGLQTRWRDHKSRRKSKPSNRNFFVPINLD